MDGECEPGDAPTETARIDLRCRRCRASIEQVEVNVYRCPDCGGVHPREGTLTGDWARRWFNAHQEPTGVVWQ